LILQVLAERNELSTRHGRAAFAILLFQDLAIIPVLIALPLLAGYSSAALEPRTIALQIGVFVLVAGLGRYALRPFLRVIANTRVQEAFTAAALLVVLGTAILFQAAGLSMALGAFLAGVLLADSEYRHELEADVEPFKGLLLGLFFIAVGMTANLGEFMKTPLELLALTAGFVAVKGLAVWLAARLSRYGHSTAWRLGASLAGGGEFAFVLLAIAARDRVIDAEMADRLVIVVTLSMIAAPLVIALADAVARKMRGRPAPATYDRIESEEPRVLIAGFGRFGQIVGRVLRAQRIRFTALEISQAQVDFVRRFGNKLYYGDASRHDMLRAAGAGSAELLVLAIDDVDASVRTADLVRRHFPNLRILARARNRQHAFRLMDAGVDQIWRETLGSSLEMAESALVELGTDAETAAAHIRTFRAHDQATLLAQAAVKDDEAKLIASTTAAARQLESLFEADVR
jgi:glutathione-regulated potassium-efflux system ancillary protein KefC/glutathione-regulated potassium-efflux system protein KefB